MTPAAPTWDDIETFVNADGWREVPRGERGGSSSDHIFYDKALPDGRLLQTHISHSRKKTVSAGRFGAILRDQLEVSKDEFWECVRTGKPVDRPVPLDEIPTHQHPAWDVNVLVNDLHLTADQVMALSPEEAQERVYQHWASG